MGLNVDLARMSNWQLAYLARVAGKALRQSTEEQNWPRHDEAMRFLVQIQMEYELRADMAAEREANQLSLGE